jgi:predicted O-methyltransferase YrrM
MLIKPHWTLRYVASRLALMGYERKNPDAPWLTPAAVSILETLLLPTDIALEWGSGRSTAWIAKRVQHLTSVEDNREWFDRVSEKLRADGISNVDYRFKALPSGGLHAPDTPYVGVVGDFADERVDFVLVDGQARPACATRVLPKLTAGGAIVIDNIEWFLEWSSDAPRKLRTKSPDWDEFVRRVSDWRMIWTSSGVTSTAIWLKPGLRAPHG